MSGRGGRRGPPTTVPDGTDRHARVRTVAGVLNVDYARTAEARHRLQLGQHRTRIYGMTVGNGRVGAMVWSQNRARRCRFGNVDASSRPRFSPGLVNLNTTPALDAGGGAFQQRLALYDGSCRRMYGTTARSRSSARRARRSSASTSSTRGRV
jgi:hypothetical protein